jgi:uracil-DNA glycosylase family 4
MTDSLREKAFHNLIARVQACRKCERMRDSKRVLSPGCGPIDSPIMFIGEAPGRLGADDSQLPFHGDKSGHNFEALMEQVGISRYHAFVTNAVLCNPKDMTTRNNATPTKIEIENCSAFLKEQIELVDPKVVVTLGATALKACDAVSPHGLELRQAVRTKTNWINRMLIPAYHPGQRAMIHRSFANQLADYKFIEEETRRLLAPNKKRGVQRRVSGDSEKLSQVVERIVSSKSEGISYFALHKLYFLAEVACLEQTGQRLVNSYVVRQKDGPYCVDLHLKKLKTMIPRLEKTGYGNSLRLFLNPQLEIDTQEPTLTESERELIDGVTGKYAHLTDADLKRRAYMTRLVREILKREKSQGLDLFNIAVLPFASKS